MELPKNIIQIGKPDKTHKIFVEDYVITYIKQLYKSNEEKKIGLALYGKLYEESDIRYYFLYGATVIEGLENRGPYLSQAEKEEIQNVGKKYFEEYQFLAWCNIKGEPVEGFYIQIQGKGIEINGYACFYEKNESMLNYMLINGVKKKEEKVENMSEEKKITRGDWKSSDYVKPAPKTVASQTQKGTGVTKKAELLKVAFAAAFLGLCVIGITTLNDYDKMQDLQVAARQVLSSLTEQKIPDASDNEEISSFIGVSGNGMVSSPTKVPGNEMASVSGGETENTSVSEVVPTSQQKEIESNMENKEVTTVSDDTPANVIPVQETLPVMYTIIKGDTLISICTREYGSIDNLQRICDMNDIANPDDIKVGQTILLP